MGCDNWDFKMPYVTQHIRRAIEADPHSVKGSGDLSFQLCEVINDFLRRTPNGGWEGAIAKVLSAVEGARIAFEDEVVRPYEAKKREENGAVFLDWHALQR